MLIFSFWRFIFGGFSADIPKYLLGFRVDFFHKSKVPFEKNIVHRRFRYPLKHLSDFKLFLVCRLSLAYFQSNKLLSIDYGWNLDTYHEFVKKCKRHYWWRITFWSCKSVSMLELWSRTVSTIYLGKASWTGMACLWRMMRIRPGGTVSMLVGTRISRKLHFIHTINIDASKKSNLKAIERNSTFKMQIH